MDCSEFLKDFSFLSLNGGLKYLSVLSESGEMLGVFSYLYRLGKVEIVSIDEDFGVSVLRQHKIFLGAIEEVVKKYSPVEVQYLSDLCWGGSYVKYLKRAGFKLCKEIKPRYTYNYKHNRIAKPSKLQYVKNTGKIWDCGYEKYCLITGG